MARKRMIDPGIWTSEDFGTLSNLAKILFIGLISMADDYGRLKWSVVTIKATVLPLGSEDLTRIHEALREIVKRKMAIPYEVDGKEYAVLPAWNAYQKVAHPSKPQIPDPPTGYKNTHESSRILTNVHESSPQEVLGEGKGRGENQSTSPPPSKPRRIEQSPDPVVMVVVGKVNDVFESTALPTPADREALTSIFDLKGEEWVLQVAREEHLAITEKVGRHRSHWPYFRAVLQGRISRGEDSKPGVCPKCGAAGFSVNNPDCYHAWGRRLALKCVACSHQEGTEFEVPRGREKPVRKYQASESRDGPVVQGLGGALKEVLSNASR